MQIFPIKREGSVKLGVVWCICVCFVFVYFYQFYEHTLCKDIVKLCKVDF